MFSRPIKRVSKLRKYTSSARILHITDSEGDRRHFLSQITNSQVVKYRNDRLFFHDSKETPYFIFGGDATDRNNSDLELSQLMVDFKQRYPEQVFLLVGNRDITKNRFKIELDPRLIKARLLNTEMPRWLPENPTYPLDYLKKAMIEQNFHGSAAEYLSTLSIEQCQIIYLKWMLEKTMGCPHSFRYRKEELAILYPDTRITDTMVLESFIKESRPEGINGQYLQHAQVAVMVPNTQVLAIHGGLLADNIGRIPGMSPSDSPIRQVNLWVEKFNHWYKEQINQWINYQPNKLTMPAFTALDECVLPIPNKPKSIITATMFNDQRQFIKIPEYVSDYLHENGIQLVLTGHQPCGDHPAILRGDGLLFINGDTGYAAGAAQAIDDTRKGATHCLEIMANKERTEINIWATLPDQTKIETALAIEAGIIEGDPYIGQVTSKQELVQCRLADGKYRLANQQGYQVKYSLASNLDLDNALASLKSSRAKNR